MKIAVSVHMFTECEATTWKQVALCSTKTGSRGGNWLTPSKDKLMHIHKAPMNYDEKTWRQASSFQSLCYYAKLTSFRFTALQSSYPQDRSWNSCGMNCTYEGWLCHLLSQTGVASQHVMTKAPGSRMREKEINLFQAGETFPPVS